MAGKHTGRQTEDSTNFPIADFSPRLDKAFSEGMRLNPAANPHVVGSPAAQAYTAGVGSSAAYETDGTFGYTQTLGDWGSGTAVLTTAEADQANVTLSVWIKNDTTDWTGVALRNFVCWGDGATAGNRGVRLAKVGTTDGFQVLMKGPAYAVEGSAFESATSRTGAALAHLALVIEGGARITGYLNGVQILEDSSSVPATIELSSSVSLRIGGDHNVTTATNDMIIGDLWIGYVAATLAQIQGIYNAGVPSSPGATGTAGAYKALGVTPIVLLGGPAYDWTDTPLLNGGSLGTFTVTGTVS